MFGTGKYCLEAGSLADFVVDSASTISGTTRLFICFTISGLQYPSRAALHPLPHSVSLRKRTDSSRIIMVVKVLHNSKAAISTEVHFLLLPKRDATLTEGSQESRPSKNVKSSKRYFHHFLLFSKQPIKHRQF